MRNEISYLDSPDLIYKKYLLETEEINHEYLKDLMILNIYESNDGDKPLSDEEKKAFSKYIDKSKKAFHHLIDRSLSGIHRVTHPKDDLTDKEYKKAQVGNVKIRGNIKKENEKIIKTNKTGKKLMNQVSSGKEVNTEELNNFCNKAKNTIKNNDTEILSSAMVVGDLINSEKLLSDMKDEYDGFANLGKNAATVDQRTKIRKIMDGMNYNLSSSINTINICTNDIK